MNGEVHHAERCKAVSFMKMLFQLIGRFSTFAWKEIFEFQSFPVSEQKEWGFYRLWDVLQSRKAGSQKLQL